MTVLRVAVPVADLLRDPGGARDRQLLMGEAVRVRDERDGWVRAEALRDGYPGCHHGLSGLFEHLFAFMYQRIGRIFGRT